MPTLAAACLFPFGLLGLFWVFLAYRRARATDPSRPLREARQRIGETLQALRGAPSAGRQPLLIAWQRDAAVLWGIAHAAPPASSLVDGEWSALWTEADRCLYGADKLLPGDWVARANAALAKKPLRPFNAARVLLPGNLLPFVFLAMAALLGRPPLDAADPAAAYRRGDFESAGNAWEKEVAADPLAWTARHNLSLALGQRDRWGEAAAQAAAAFVQNPSDPASRRQMALACDRAGFVPEPLDILLQPGPVESLARLEPPGGWQRMGAGASALAAGALALLLAGSYGGRRRAWERAAALTVLAAALLLGAASVAGYRAYGITADSRAVVVWRAGILRSIPTEADVSQKTTPLAAGSAAIADKAFLGWIRVAFPNGETGWIQRGEAVFLWGRPPD
jgi:tetratricopeptide (TPR) repeat protein